MPMAWKVVMTAIQEMDRSPELRTTEGLLRSLEQSVQGGNPQALETSSKLVG